MASFQIMNYGSLNCHITEYKFGNLNNHDPLRKRKLLINKREIRKD